jgi:hypothetical protein
MMVLVRDLTSAPRDLGLALLLGVVAAGLPYGYLVALVLGTVIAHTKFRVTVA